MPYLHQIGDVRVVTETPEIPPINRDAPSPKAFWWISKGQAPILMRHLTAKEQAKNREWREFLRNLKPRRKTNGNQR